MSQSAGTGRWIVANRGCKSAILHPVQSAHSSKLKLSLSPQNQVSICEDRQLNLNMMHAYQGREVAFLRRKQPFPIQHTQRLGSD